MRKRERRRRAMRNAEAEGRKAVAEARLHLSKAHELVDEARAFLPVAGGAAPTAREEAALRAAVADEPGGPETQGPSAEHPAGS